MTSVLYPILSLRFPHERDKNICFQEEGHKYTILTDPDSTYTSVTTWNHSHFGHFNADEIIRKMMSSKSWKEGHKYWGLSGEEIKDQWNNNRDNAAGAGTQLHYEIECFMNSNLLLFQYTHLELIQFYDMYVKYDKSEMWQSKEWLQFIRFVEQTPKLKPYRTEWMIYHEELKLSGSIDMVYENPDGSLSIYDWKRSKEISYESVFNKRALTPVVRHMDDCNFSHYALQLNTYKAILEQKYGKVVKELFLVRLHPEADDYEVIEVPILTNEIAALFQYRASSLLLV